MARAAAEHAVARTRRLRARLLPARRWDRSREFCTVPVLLASKKEKPRRPEPARPRNAIQANNYQTTGTVTQLWLPSFRFGTPTVAPPLYQVVVHLLPV